MSYGKKLVLTVLLVALVSIAANGYAVYYWASRTYAAPGPLTADKIVLIPKGAGLRQIALQLQNEGIIERDWLFSLAAFIEGKQRAMKPGEYQFTVEQSMQSVADQIADGKILSRKITFQEGITSKDIVEKLRAVPELSGEIANIPSEGTLLPETYVYYHGDDRAAVLNRMQSAMRELLTAELPKRAENAMVRDENEVLTLASIIEKETAIASERGMVAGVYTNRLRIGMALQADPTVRYAMGLPDSSHPITYADLQRDHPYNTYVRTGLPPGPICNPGRDSILAALHPAVTDALYFVADGKGGHNFAPTLQQHNKNVTTWRQKKRPISPAKKPASGRKVAPVKPSAAKP